MTTTPLCSRTYFFYYSAIFPNTQKRSWLSQTVTTTLRGGTLLDEKICCFAKYHFFFWSCTRRLSSSDSDFALSSERTSKFRRSLNVKYSRRAYEERLRYLSRDWCKTERALDCPSPCSKRQTAAKLKSTSSEAENENYP